jgi:hypothetical protein
MDPTYVLVLAIALIVALASVGLIRARIRATAPDPRESPFAVSTEGMKICARCGMGNLWTEGRCSSCGRPLKG